MCVVHCGVAIKNPVHDAHTLCAGALPQDRLGQTNSRTDIHTYMHDSDEKYLRWPPSMHTRDNLAVATLLAPLYPNVHDDLRSRKNTRSTTSDERQHQSAVHTLCRLLYVVQQWDGYPCMYVVYRILHTYVHTFEVFLKSHIPTATLRAFVPFSETAVHHPVCTACHRTPRSRR